MGTLIAIAIVIIAVGRFLVVRGNRDNNIEPTPTPTATPAPTDPLVVDGSFSVFSSTTSTTQKDNVLASIQFLSDGSVLSEAELQGNIEKSEIGNITINDFTSDPLFQVVGPSGGSLQLNGPTSGKLNDSPKWSAEITPQAGTRSVVFFVKVFDELVEKVFRVSLIIDVADLTV